MNLPHEVPLNRQQTPSTVRFRSCEREPHHSRTQSSQGRTILERASSSEHSPYRATPSSSRVLTGPHHPGARIILERGPRRATPSSSTVFTGPAGFCHGRCCLWLRCMALALQQPASQGVRVLPSTFPQGRHEPIVSLKLCSFVWREPLAVNSESSGES